MKKSISLWQFAGFALTSLFGTLLHFLYEWTNGSLIVAPIAGVNESTWEHMKLLFFPMLAFGVAEYFFFKDTKSFWCVKARGIVLGLMLIPLIFYMLNGIFGKTPDFINIAIFFISAASVFVYETRLFKRDIPCPDQRLPVALLSVIAFLFVLFTFVTPKIALFRDPINGGYGV